MLQNRETNLQPYVNIYSKNIAICFHKEHYKYYTWHNLKILLISAHKTNITGYIKYDLILVLNTPTDTWSPSCIFAPEKHMH